jgi:AraC-like DNA-binding protein
VHVSGAVPEGTIGVCARWDDVAACSAWGRPFSTRDVSVVAGELTAVLGDGATLLAAVVSRGRLLRVADALGIELDPAVIRSSGLLASAEPRARTVRHELEAALWDAPDPAAGAEQASRVVAIVAEALARPEAGRPETSRRLDLARATRDYLDASLGRTVRLEDVVQAVGADVRRVQRAFHDVYGTTPFRYLRVIRLLRARRALQLASADSTTVTRVAIDSGLDHLGRFSVDYRRMFGESPSVTLTARRPRQR